MNPYLFVLCWIVFSTLALFVMAKACDFLTDLLASLYITNNLDKRLESIRIPADNKSK